MTPNNMKIYTKTGDQGQTSLLSGGRVSKSDIRIEAYGTVDELNSYLGLVRDQEVNKVRSELLEEIQEKLFVIGAILAAGKDPEKMKLPQVLNEDVEKLEAEIDMMEGALSPLKNFILPGGHHSVSYTHITRCICRRAERLVIALHEQHPVNTIIIIYLNRLSDYLFVLSRKMSLELGVEEHVWKGRKA